LEQTKTLLYNNWRTIKIKNKEIKIKIDNTVQRWKDKETNDSSRDYNSK